MSSPKREDGEQPAPKIDSGADAEMKSADQPSRTSPPPSVKKEDASISTEPAGPTESTGPTESAEVAEGSRKRKDNDDTVVKTEPEEGETEEKPKTEPKRRRIDDGKRSARMFGNILGTLRKFQDDEGKTKKSEAAQRRAATQSRIAARLQTDTIQSSALLAAERELRTLQAALASDTFADRELAAEARHALLESAKGYLSTTPLPPLSKAGLNGGGHSQHPTRRDSAAGPPAAEQLYPGDLLPGASLASSKGLSALYFLPRILTPEQEDMLRRQEREVSELIERERGLIEAERERHAETRAAQEKKLRELRRKVDELRAAEKEKHAGQAMDVEV